MNARGRRAWVGAVTRTEDERIEVGLLGRRNTDSTYTFKVVGRRNYLYVKVRASNGVQSTVPAYNRGGVRHAPDLAVDLIRRNQRYIILGESDREELALQDEKPASGVPVHTHDDRYFTEAEHLSVSTGAGDAGKPVVLDAAGHVDASMINDADIDIAPIIHAATLDTTPLDADEVPTLDSSASFALIRTTWTNIKAFLKTYFDTLYFVVAGKAGGQIAYGGTGSGDDLTLQSTAHATKGDLLLPDNIVKFGDGLAALSVQFNGAVATTRDFAFLSAGVFRWILRINSNAESGGDVGSNLEIQSRTDAGAAKQTLMFFERATGYVGIGLTALAAKLHVLQPTLGEPVMWLTSTSTGTDPNDVVYQNRITTTNATVTTLHTFVIAASNTWFIEVKVVARRTGGTAGTAEDGAAYVIRGTFKNIAGVATIIGAIQQSYVAEDQAGWDATFDVDGAGNARVRVTGALNNNIVWHMPAARLSFVGT